MNLMTASNQWAFRPSDQRFQSLSDLRDSVHGRRMRSRSADLDLTQVKATHDNGRIVLNSNIEACEPTHWAFGQLATTVSAPAGYLRSLPADMVVPLLNYGLENKPVRDNVKLLTVTRDEGNGLLQAVTSVKYGRIWDADVVDAVERVVERTGGKFHNPLAYAPGKFGGSEAAVPSGLYASDHDVFIFMIDGGSLLEAGERAQLNRGFITWNSETGARTFGLMTFLFNVCCGNHIIWGAQDINKLIIRHTGGGPYRFDSEAAPTLQAFTEASEKPILDAVRRAQDYLLPAEAPKLLEFVMTRGFTRAEATRGFESARTEEGECRTLWQLVQGLTAYARGFDYIDARVDLEQRAGKLLNLVARE